MRNLGDLVTNYGGIVAALDDGRILATLQNQTMNVWRFQAITSDGTMMFLNTEAFTIFPETNDKNEIVKYVQNILEDRINV